MHHPCLVTRNILQVAARRRRRLDVLPFTPRSTTTTTTHPAATTTSPSASIASAVYCNHYVPCCLDGFRRSFGSTTTRAAKWSSPSSSSSSGDDRTTTTRSIPRMNSNNNINKTSSINNNSSSNNNKKKKILSVGSHAGRIASIDVDTRSSGKGRNRKAVAAGRAVKVCSGCGVEIISAASAAGAAAAAVTSSSTNQTGKILSGTDAINEGRSKIQAKKARYADVMDSAHSTTLCARCKSLQSGDVWKAYDALRDVDASVFSNQLRHIVGRRKFGMCIVVVDATDPEFSAVKNLRTIVGSTPCMLVVNKVDLLPRMNVKDLRYLKARVEQRGVQFLDVYAVSAQTGHGLVHLAEGLLSQLGGRDVFVVGSANVGKSTLTKSLSSLLAKTLYLKGTTRQASRRKDVMNSLAITSSHLPGTTLQAVRIPCFPSHRQALWDTPGIINTYAMDYSLFPSHLLEQLAYPARITIPNEQDGTKVLVRPGESILIDAGWINESLKDDNVPALTLARLDVVQSSNNRPVEALAFVPTSLNVRVVPTEEAPTSAEIPLEYARAVQERTGARGNFDNLELTRPLAVYTEGDQMTEGILELGTKNGPTHSEWVRQDIVFASLGWIMLCHRGSFRVRPMCVDGSRWLKRRSLYPSNLLDDDSNTSRDDDGWEKEASRLASPEGLSLGDEGSEEFRSVRRRLKSAAEQGKHLSNTRKNVHRDYYGGGNGDNGLYYV